MFHRVRDRKGNDQGLESLHHEPTLTMILVIMVVLVMTVIMAKMMMAVIMVLLVMTVIMAKMMMA